MRHSVNLALNDAFAILPNRLKSVGFTDENKGYTEITTYIDKNKNGKFDKGDIGVKNVPVKCSWINDEVYTNCDGKVIPQSIDKGIYKVKLDVDKLPATLMADKIHPNETVVRIDGRKITKVEFPLKSCVGNITGKLTILDDFGRSFNINDFIVVLNDESDNEVAYSTVDCNGNFYFSGIEPGKYAVELDEGFVESSSLYSYEDKSSINIEIPYVYEDFVDINNVNLIYKTY